MATVIFTGNVGKEPDLKFGQSGRARLAFSVCDSKSKPDGNGGWEKLAEQWFNVTVWGELAELYSNLLQKGSRVEVWGEFYERKYESNGVEGKSLDVNAQGIRIFPPKNGQQAPRQQGGQQAQQDPWGAPSGGSGDWGNAPTSEPPF